MSRSRQNVQTQKFCTRSLQTNTCDGTSCGSTADTRRLLLQVAGGNVPHCMTSGHTWHTLAANCSRFRACR